MSRAIDLEGEMINACDRLGVVYVQLTSLVDGSRDLDREVSSAISGSALIIKDVIDGMDDILEGEGETTPPSERG